MGFGPALIAAGASLAGGLLGDKSQRAMAEDNIKFQKEFAQNGIRWKVEDAKAAGLHPLAALGAQTTSFSPISIGNPLGDAVANMGQDLSRAWEATRTKNERQAESARAAARQETADRMAVEKHQRDLTNMDLQNQLLRSQINRLNSAQVGPGMPDNLSSTSGRSANGVGPGVSRTEPALLTSRNKDQPALQAGTPEPGMRKFRIGGKDIGFDIELPGQPMAESMDPYGPTAALGYHVLHAGGRVLDRVMKGGGTSHLPPAPKGYSWKWNVYRQVYEMKRN